jgi:hypothetical protein
LRAEALEEFSEESGKKVVAVNCVSGRNIISFCNEAGAVMGTVAIVVDSIENKSSMPEDCFAGA